MYTFAIFFSTFFLCLTRQATLSICCVQNKTQVPRSRMSLNINYTRNPHFRETKARAHLSVLITASRAPGTKFYDAVERECSVPEMQEMISYFEVFVRYFESLLDAQKMIQQAKLTNQASSAIGLDFSIASDTMYNYARLDIPQRIENIKNNYNGVIRELKRAIQRKQTTDFY